MEELRASDVGYGRLFLEVRRTTESEGADEARWAHPLILLKCIHSSTPTHTRDIHPQPSVLLHNRIVMREGASLASYQCRVFAQVIELRRSMEIDPRKLPF